MYKAGLERTGVPLLSKKSSSRLFANSSMAVKKSGCLKPPKPSLASLDSTASNVVCS